MLATTFKWFTGIWLALVSLAMFLWVPAHEGLGNVGRIVIVHVPTGWLTSVAFLFSAIYSWRYLRNGRARDDALALAAAELGLIFSILATVTGSMFAKVVWGTYWNWDPRETAIAALMLIYAAYFALRTSIEDRQRQRYLGSIYALLAFVAVPFLIFVIPRVTDDTLHPNCAILNTPNCQGIQLTENGRIIGTIEDFKVELLGIEQQADLTVATVSILSNGTNYTLKPSFNRASNKPEAIERLPETLRDVQIKRLSGQPGNQTVEIAIANTGNIGLLTEQRTLLTFFASLFGFTLLFFWLWWLRADVLDINEQLVQQGITI